MIDYNHVSHFQEGTPLLFRYAYDTKERRRGNFIMCFELSVVLANALRLAG